MNDDTTIGTETIERTVRTIAPEWSLRAHEPAKGGYLPVHVLKLDTPVGPKRAVLKASPNGESHGIDVEARILRLLDANTSIPVPEVYGAVDEHDDLPAPYFLAGYAPGVTVERNELDTLPDGRLEQLARASGRYLAELHDLTLFDGYGYLTRNPDNTLRGARPPASPDTLVVADPVETWKSQIRAWADDTLTRAADTRFGDLVDDIGPFLDDRIGRLEGPFRPVLGHIDNSVENVRHDPETGDITGMLDWAFSLSVTPAYDLVLIEQSMNGGQWRLLPDSPDYTDRIRPALLDGYREAGSPRVFDELAEHRDLYELLTLLRSMNNLETWLSVKGATSEQVDAAARAVRETALAIVDGR
ncbi:phosphotransferase family protein [Haloarchaeobius sp. HME9146]|uniref:phosphotransferase family protein n=1 Tax=Haloarchaeobius sp. HME9146 TaxID=2978732 RepID=UPI0021BEDB35|nr:phosphotransferase [Haloarchaeobius sp. HME9146]MCT9094760.1 phosphotransferase [Haloarchaeobius sp. HME9146]